MAIYKTSDKYVSKVKNTELQDVFDNFSKTDDVISFVKTCECGRQFATDSEENRQFCNFGNCKEKRKELEIVNKQKDEKRRERNAEQLKVSLENKDILNVNAHEKIKKENKKAKVMLFTVASIIAVVLTSAILLIVYNRPNVTNEAIEKPSIIQEDVPPITLISREGRDHRFLEIDNMKLPVTFANWLTVPFHTWEDLPEDQQEELRKQAINWSRGISVLLNISSQMDTLENGFTNNPDDVWTEDGLLNISYQYILREDLEYWFAVQFNRLINPLFGGWAEHQENIYFNEMHFSDYIENLETVFVPELWDNFTNEHYRQSMPVVSSIVDLNYSVDIYANEDFFVGFFGQPILSKIEASAELIDGNIRIWNFVIPMEFVAFSEENEVMSIYGELYLQLTPFFTDDPNDFDNPRIRIFDYRLTIQNNTIQKRDSRGNNFTQSPQWRDSDYYNPDNPPYGDDIYNPNYQQGNQWDYIYGDISHAWFTDFHEEDDSIRSFLIGNWTWVNREEEGDVIRSAEFTENNFFILKDSILGDIIYNWNIRSSDTILICEPQSPACFEYSFSVNEINRNEVTFILIENPQEYFILRK
jgi:hypothetical protein